MEWSPDVHNPYLNCLMHIGEGVVQFGSIDYELYRWNGKELDEMRRK